jgi:hypothetical protein
LLLGEPRRGATGHGIANLIQDFPEHTLPRHPDHGRTATAGGVGSRRQDAARVIKWAQILLATAAGAKDDTIAQRVGVGTSTVYRTKQRFIEPSGRPRASKHRADCRSESLARGDLEHRRAHHMITRLSLERHRRSTSFRSASAGHSPGGRLNVSSSALDAVRLSASRRHTTRATSPPWSQR